MGYLNTETKFDRNFSLGDSRNIEESISLYEKNWKKIVSASKKFPKNLKKMFVFAPRLLKVSVAALVKFTLSCIKSVTFFRVFSFPMFRTLIYSEVLRAWFCFSRYRFACYRLGIFGNSKIKKKLKNVVTLFCRKFPNFCKTHSEKDSSIFRLSPSGKLRSNFVSVIRYPIFPDGMLTWNPMG